MMESDQAASLAEATKVKNNLDIELMVGFSFNPLAFTPSCACAQEIVDFVTSAAHRHARKLGKCRRNSAAILRKSALLFIGATAI